MENYLRKNKDNKNEIIENKYNSLIKRIIFK